MVLELIAVKVVPSRRSKLFLNPETLTEQSVGQLKSKNHDAENLKRGTGIRSLPYIGLMEKHQNRSFIRLFSVFNTGRVVFRLRKTSVLEST